MAKKPNSIYGQPETALREFRRERENQGEIGWVPCYISPVERLVLPVCRIWFLICSEGFSCQSLDVLQPNTAGPSSSSSIVLAVGHGRVEKRKGEALNNLPVTISHLQQHGSHSFTFHTASRERGTQNACMPSRREEDACCKNRFKKESKPVHTTWHFARKQLAQQLT